MAYTKRDPYGNKIKPEPDIPNKDDENTDARNDERTHAHVPMVMDNILAKINDDSPAVAINDTRIENFICMITEDSLHGMAAMVDAYKKCGFDIDRPMPLLKNDIRKLLSHKRVKERLNYMRECEWEINKPDMSLICKNLNDIIEDGDIAVNAKITAINSLAKLAGMFEQNQHRSDTKVAVIFNTQEKPPIDVTVTQVK